MRFRLALLALIAFCYLPGLASPAAYDDLYGVLLNPRLKDASAVAKGFRDPAPVPPEGVRTPGYAWRPLTEASFALNLWAGLQGLRILNILLHWGSCLAVLWVVAQLFPAERHLGRWAALCFAVHPLGVAAVTYVYQRFTGLEALLAFLTLGLYWTARGKTWGGRYLGALACGLLTMMAKETGATLPLMLAAVEWILRDPVEPARAVWKRWLPFACLPLLVLIQVHRAELLQVAASGEGLAAMAGFRRSDYALIQLPMVMRYLGFAAFPFPLRFVFDRIVHAGVEIPPPPLGPALASGALLLGLLAWTLFGPRKHRLPRLGLALFLAPLALESSVFPTVHVGWTYRCYPGLLGAGLVFAWAATRIRAWMPGMALVLLACAAWGENRLWSRQADLLCRDVRNAFHDPLTWRGVAEGYLTRGHPKESLGLMTQALRFPCHTARLRETAIRALLAQGKPEATVQAHGLLARSLQDFPQDPDILWLAVEEAERLGEPQRLARLASREALVQVPRPELALWFADRHAGSSDPAGGEAVLRRSLGQYPLHPQLWESLGRVQASQGHLDEAERSYRRALALFPGFAQAHLNLGALLFHRKDLEGAEAEFRQALRLDPGYTKARENLERIAGLKGAGR